MHIERLEHANRKMSWNKRFMVKYLYADWLE